MAKQCRQCHQKSEIVHRNIESTAQIYKKKPRMLSAIVFSRNIDYVVCVLDTPLGSWLGWMGSRTYNDDRDDEPYWAHVGYASDMHECHYPTYQDGVVLEEEDGGRMKAMSSTTADVTRGHSGGPVFGWWDGGPYVVGVVSGEARNKNWISGGTAMVNLIKQAHTHTP